MRALKKAFLSVLLVFLVTGQVNAESYQRIVSLAPALTEILYAMDLEDRIIGVTTFCDYPPRAKEKPKVGGMSNPSLEAIVSLKPDIVVMTTDGNPKEFEEQVRRLGIRTYVFTARRIPELPQAIRDLGTALGVTERAEALANTIETSIDTIKHRKSNRRSPAAMPRIIFIVWPEPLIAAGPGTAVDDSLQLLGAVNIAGDAVTQYPKYSIEEIINRSPDIIFIGKGMGGSADMKELSRGILKKLEMLEAVKKERVYYISD
ncbi:MAG: ABC transporter substrate-binding protein, partial [bacterium]